MSFLALASVEVDEAASEGKLHKLIFATQSSGALLIYRIAYKLLTDEGSCGMCLIKSSEFYDFS